MANCINHCDLWLFLQPNIFQLPLVILPFTRQAGEHGPSAWLARCPAMSTETLWIAWFLSTWPGELYHFWCCSQAVWRLGIFGDVYCTGAYEDPEHPGCKREVRVEGMKVPWQSEKSDSMTGTRWICFGNRFRSLAFPICDGSHCWKAHHSFSGIYVLPYLGLMGLLRFL